MASSLSPDKLADLLLLPSTTTTGTSTGTPSRTAVVDLSDWTVPSFATTGGKTIVGSMAGPGSLDAFRLCADTILSTLVAGGYDAVVFVCQRGQTRSPACAALFSEMASAKGVGLRGIFYLRGGLDKFVDEYGHDSRLVYPDARF